MKSHRTHRTPHVSSGGGSIPPTHAAPPTAPPPAPPPPPPPPPPATIPIPAPAAASTASASPPSSRPPKTKRGKLAVLIVTVLVVVVLLISRESATHSIAVAPICADAQDLQIPEDKTLVEIRSRTECFSGPIQTPLRWPKWWGQFPAGKGGEIWFRGAALPTALAPGRSSDPKTGLPYSFPGQFVFMVRGEGMFVVRRGETEIRAEVRP